MKMNSCAHAERGRETSTTQNIFSTYYLTYENIIVSFLYTYFITTDTFHYCAWAKVARRNTIVLLKSYNLQLNLCSVYLASQMDNGWKRERKKKKKYDTTWITDDSQMINVYMTDNLEANSILLPTHKSHFLLLTFFLIAFFFYEKSRFIA